LNFKLFIIFAISLITLIIIAKAEPGYCPPQDGDYECPMPDDADDGVLPQ
jgi:hypothetical protein